MYYQRGGIDVTVVLIVIVIIFAVMLAGGPAIKPDPMYPTPMISGSPAPEETIEPTETASRSANTPATESGSITP